MSDTARCMRTANGMKGANRPSHGMSTPFQYRLSTRTASVSTTATPSSASVAVCPANDQSSARWPPWNQVSWAKRTVTAPSRTLPAVPPRVWIATPDEAEPVGRLLADFRSWYGKDWPSDNAFHASVERLIEQRDT